MMSSAAAMFVFVVAYILWKRLRHVPRLLWTVREVLAGPWGAALLVAAVLAAAALATRYIRLRWSRDRAAAGGAA